MQNPFRNLKDVFSKPVVDIPSTGLYHFRYDQLDEKSRIHLRIDEDGSGVLIINANRVMHLNQTAAWMAIRHLEKKPALETLKSIQRRYHVALEQLKADYDQIAVPGG